MVYRASGNIEFGQFVRALRAQRMFFDGSRLRQWTREQLSREYEALNGEKLSIRTITRLERGEVTNLRPFLEPLASVFRLSEAEKSEFYAVAGYIYLSSQRPDRDAIERLFQEIDYPASAKTPLWDFIAFNQYHYLLWGYTPDKIRRLDEGSFGPNLLRVLFEPEFEHQIYIGGEARWEEDTRRSVNTFRLQSFPYIRTRRHGRIVAEMMRLYPRFQTEWWNWPVPLTARQPVYPVTRVHHPEFGVMEFLSLRTPQKYLGSQVDISIYVPLTASAGNYQRLREQVRLNTVHSFREEPVI